MEKIHVSATSALALAIPLLMWVWTAQADDLDATILVAGQNAKAIAVIISEQENQADDIQELDKDIQAIGRTARNVEMTLISIATKLEVEHEFETVADDPGT